MKTNTTRRGVLALVLAVLVLPFALGGCRTNAESGALIGAGAGALGGYMIGNEMDKGDDYDGGHYYHRHYHRW